MNHTVVSLSLDFLPRDRHICFMPFQLPLNQIIQIADRHTLAVQWWLSSRSPKGIQIKYDVARLGSTGLPVPLLNLALGCDFTNDATIDDEIESIKNTFAKRNVPWYWWIGTKPHPNNFAERLGQHNIVVDRPPLPAMATELPQVLPPIPRNIRVWQATTRQDLEAASTIRRVAFRFAEGVALDYFESMANDWLRGDPAKLYLASLDEGPPASIGALLMGEGIPGVYVMATLPEWGRKGLGKAILTRILQEAMQGGHSLIVLTASRFGYPLYQQFGFEHIFDYSLYQLKTKA